MLKFNADEKREQPGELSRTYPSHAVVCDTNEACNNLKGDRHGDTQAENTVLSQLWRGKKNIIQMTD